MKALLAAALLASTMGVGSSVVSPCAAAAQAEGVHRAGLVVDFGKTPAKLFCVQFKEASISAIEQLQRTGLALSVQDFGGGNVAVCSIGGQGCNYPKGSCWCHCTNLNDCLIWGLYTLDAKGEWRFSDEGAAVRKVGDGDVVAWHWAKQSTTGGAAPAKTTLQNVCAAGTTISAVGIARAKPARPGLWPALLVLGAGALVLVMWSSRRKRRVVEQ